jgi:bacterioferritin-associated ferredoxin
VSGKVVLCRCEDVTLADVEKAIATGFAALEEVKRYTGFGTGPCQGKECLREIAATIARLTGRPSEEIAPFTSRAPLYPTPLVVFATPPDEASASAAHAAAKPPFTGKVG